MTQSKLRALGSAGASLWQLDLLALAGLAGVTAVCWMLLISPALGRSHREEVARSELTSLHTEVTQQSRSIAAAQAELQQTRAELEHYRQPCWTDFDRSRRLEWLYSIARQSGVEVETVEPSDTEVVSGRRVLPIRVTGRGAYLNVMRAMRDIREAMPDVVVRGLDLASSGAMAGDARVVNINLELYWLPAQVEGTEATAGAR